MTFSSILVKDSPRSPVAETLVEPECFADLNLDQIVNAITAGKREYNLKPFFYAPLRDADTVKYRQEVAQDLEDATLLDHVRVFAGRMSQVRRYLAMIRELTYPYHRAGWFLEAVALYCVAVTELAQGLQAAGIRSRGLRALCAYISEYAASDRFVALQSATQTLKADLSMLSYCVLIRGNRVEVHRYRDELDYSAEIEALFGKFKHGAVKDYTVDLALGAGMNHVEARILDLVARLFPEVFARLEQYPRQNDDFLDETIQTFDREVQFYVAYLTYIAKVQHTGLPFCYPQVVTEGKEIRSYDGFDLALAQKLASEGSAVVCNDFYLKGIERVLVVSGPNQGGKTTFARAFGQLHYLASLGCPVPGREAQLYLFDKVLTHFEREEDLRNLRGKLEDDLVRIRKILGQATPDSLIIMNELFTSTTLTDAVLLGKRVMATITDLDCLAVYVTFIDELASCGEKVVSMVGTISPEDPILRTYKIVRKRADGLAYALSIAAKHRLTYTHLLERIP